MLQLFDKIEDAQEYIMSNLLSIIEFRDSWKRGGNFDNEILLNVYHIEKVNRDDKDEDWEFVEDIDAYLDSIICPHDSRKYCVIDNEINKTLKEFDNYDAAETFGEVLDIILLFLSFLEMAWRI